MFVFEANAFGFKPPLLERVLTASNGKGKPPAAVDDAMPG